MTSIRPSRVRERILREHRSLRARLDELEKILEHMASGAEQVAARALEQARALYAELRTHIDHEDSVLLPALRDADAWGEVRAERLSEHHEQQREEFSEPSLKRLSSHPPAALEPKLRELIAELRADMEHEEREVLSADILRDDVTTIDPEDG